MAGSIEGVTGLQELRPTTERSWRSGFGTLLRNELADFWGTRTWLIQVVLWLILGSGLLLLMIVPELLAAGDSGETSEGVIAIVAQMLPVTAGTLAAVAAVILAQGRIVGEKQSGTAAWVLSKPASRTAFVLARFVALGSGMITTAVAVQGAVAYAIIAVVGEPAPVIPFVAAMGAISLHILFYLALSLMLGAFCRTRNPVIAIPLLLLFAMNQWLGSFELIAVARGLLAGENVGTSGLVSAGAYAALSVGLLIVAIRRFGREEF